jgi:YebC/PmpR family DNA-binding regulatory protein
MSGHSKWATIKHKKGALDAKRGKIFSKIAKEITVTAKHGGGDPNMNPRLRTILDKARAVNMPSDNIERAIKRGTGEIEGVTYEEITYEAFAHGGVALIIDVLTDNKNRAAGDVRSILTKHGAKLAAVGAVKQHFLKRGHIVVSKEKATEDKLMEIALDAGAEDLTATDGSFEITTPVEAFDGVKKALEAASIKPDSAEITYLPVTPVPINDEQTAAAVLKLVEALEDYDDVQNVYANFDIPDAVMERATAAIGA